MKKTLSFLLLGVLILPNITWAYYTNQNFWTSTHEAPAWFLEDGLGGFYGETAGGTVFTQKPVINNFNIKLHKFSIDSAYFYISDRGVIEAPSDLMALSIYFTLS